MNILHRMKGRGYCSASDQKVRCSESTKSHARTKGNGEEFSAIVEANEPFKLVLKHTFTRNSMLGHDSIQARLGGVRLPTTIKQTDVVVTNLSNLVTVKVYSRLVSFRIVAHLSVRTFPVAVVSDGSVHLLFDLSHVVWLFDLYVVWQQMGAESTPCGH